MTQKVWFYSYGYKKYFDGDILMRPLYDLLRIMVIAYYSKTLQSLLYKTPGLKINISLFLFRFQAICNAIFQLIFAKHAIENIMLWLEFRT